MQKHLNKAAFLKFSLLAGTAWLCQLLAVPSAYGQLTIFAEKSQSGASGTCVVSTIYTDASIPGGLNNDISSITLQQGYIATLAENSDGTGEAYTFVAAVSNITVDLNPLLDNKVSFIRVLPFRQTKKKGVGNTNNAWIEPLDVDWFYDWGALDVTLPSREYAMQAWGRQAASNPANIANYIAKPDVTHLLSFNEPDNTSQANIPVSEAIPLHKLLAATGLRLGSPAPTESEAFIWLRDFMAGTRAQNIKVDHIVIHWYDWGNWNATGNTAPTPASVFNRFTAYVNRVYAMYGKPIWIKEFNANRNTTSATHEGFIALALPWLEQQPFVERYAYFFPPALPPVDANGAITPIGQAYKNFNASTPAITRNIDNTELISSSLGKRLEAEAAIRLGSNVVNCATASGGQMAQAVTGASNRITFTNVVVPEAGTYNMDVSYFTITNRNLTISINQAPGQVVAIPASGAQWCFEGGSPGKYVIPVSLLAGANTIEFSESPIIDYIEIKRDGTLPVGLLDFEGAAKSKAVELNWRTSQEQNSKHFEVLRSTDGSAFTTLGRINAAGNSTTARDYRFLDQNPASGMNFYKLRAVDKDGSFTYSNTVPVKFDSKSTRLSFVSSTGNSIRVSAYNNSSERATVKLLSMDGKLLGTQQVLLNNGMNFIDIPTTMPKGSIGLITLQTSQAVNSIKFMR